MPIIDDHDMVGSVTETRILNHLIENPEARKAPVRKVMGTPFPVVPASLHLEHLSAYLEQDVGAVLVDHGPDSRQGYSVLTKSDLISALANIGQGNNANVVQSDNANVDQGSNGAS